MTKLLSTHFSVRMACALIYVSSILNAQCVVGTNQPPFFLTPNGWNVAWPKNGSRAQAGATWINMQASGVQYIYCPKDPTPNCPGGGGDYQFGGLQIMAMETAFSTWISAKTANGSNLNFNRIYTSIFGDSPYAINILSTNTTAMGTRLASFTSQLMEVVDYNNDGVGDATRLVGAIIEVRQNVTGTTLTAAMVHELGHTFGLDDCPTCNNTTIMKTPLPTNPATAPSACDNSKIAGIM